MELENLSLIDLRNLAKDKGIPNYSKLKKSELIEKILENYNSQKNEKVENAKSQVNEVEYKLTSEDDEYVEITPEAIRLRKAILDPKDRFRNAR